MDNLVAGLMSRSAGERRSCAERGRRRVEMVREEAARGTIVFVIESFVVRPVEHGDFAAWRPLWDGYNAFYGRSRETALAPEITEMTWSRFFDPNEPVHASVAESSGKLLGLAHFLFHRSTTSIAPVCYLQDLFTVEDARGKGIGRALIHSVYENARVAGASRVYWQTHNTNAVARRLYDTVAEDSGFIVYRKLF